MEPAGLANLLSGGLNKDFRAEVTAAEMVEAGTPADRVLILMTGGMSRPYRKDIESIEEEISDYDHLEYVLVKTPREGIYDMLPEGLFHQPSAHGSAKTEKEIIRGMKQRRLEERNARKFFLPFEAAINHLRMQLALYENRLDKRSCHDELVNLFSPHWEIFQYLDARQANVFLHLIPILHDLRDDHAVFGTILEMMFLLPVSVGMRPQLPLHPAEPILSRMGDCSLGVDLTTGNAHFDEGVDEIVVRIGTLSGAQFQEFLPGGTQQKILEALCDYFLPVHMDLVTELALSDGDKATRLSDGKHAVNCVLGTDTYL